MNSLGRYGCASAGRFIARWPRPDPDSRRPGRCGPPYAMLLHAPDAGAPATGCSAERSIRARRTPEPQPRGTCGRARRPDVPRAGRSGPAGRPSRSLAELAVAPGDRMFRGPDDPGPPDTRAAASRNLRSRPATGCSAGRTIRARRTPEPQPRGTCGRARRPDVPRTGRSGPAGRPSRSLAEHPVAPGDRMLRGRQHLPPLNPTWAKLSGSPEDRPGRGSGGQGDGGAGLAQHGLPVELRGDVHPGGPGVRVQGADDGGDLDGGALVVVRRRRPGG